MSLRYELNQLIQNGYYRVAIICKLKDQKSNHVGLVSILTHKYHSLTVCMGGSREGTGGPVPQPLEIHKLIYISLEILVRTTPEKQLDPRVQLLLDEGSYGPLGNMLMT